MGELITVYIGRLKSGDFKRIGFEDRQSIERDLYLLLNQLTSKKYGIQLGGLSRPNREKLSRVPSFPSWVPEDLALLAQGFAVYDMLQESLPVDSYWLANAPKEEIEEARKPLMELGAKLEDFYQAGLNRLKALGLRD